MPLTLIASKGISIISEFKWCDLEMQNGWIVSSHCVGEAEQSSLGRDTTYDMAFHCNENVFLPFVWGAGFSCGVIKFFLWFDSSTQLITAVFVSFTPRTQAKMKTEQCSVSLFSSRPNIPMAFWLTDTSEGENRFILSCDSPTLPYSWIVFLHSPGAI